MKDKPVIKCDICGDKSHPTIDCPQRKEGMKSATERDEFDFSRYVKEFDDQNLPLMIDRPLDNTSIKKSVLWTGKPQEEIEKELEETKLLPKVSNEKYTETPKQIINPQQMIRPPNQMMRPPSFTSPPHQPISGNVIATDMTAPQQRVSIDDYIKGLEQKEKEKAKKEELFKPLDYKVPTNPIIYNPNVIKAMPTVPTQPLQPGGIGTTNGSYYNTYINPYAFQNQAVPSPSNIPMHGVGPRPIAPNQNGNIRMPNMVGQGLRPIIPVPVQIPINVTPQMIPQRMFPAASKAGVPQMIRPPLIRTTNVPVVPSGIKPPSPKKIAKPPSPQRKPQPPPEPHKHNGTHVNGNGNNMGKSEQDDDDDIKIEQV